MPDPGRDFPFYDGVPARLSGAQWAFVLATTVLGFVVLIAPWPLPAGRFGTWLRVLLFPGLPLAALAAVVGRHWMALFRPIGLRAIGLMFGFGLFNAVVTVLVAALARQVFDVSANAAVAGLASTHGRDLGLFFLQTLPQLLGEELVTMIPFLAILTVCVSGGVSRRGALVIAWLATALWFGALHLPTYGWHVAQSLLLIGLARLILTLPYILTKNLWVSTGAHVVNDWSFFVLTVLLSRLQPGP